MRCEITALRRRGRGRIRSRAGTCRHMPRGCSGSTPWPRAEMARIAERWLCHHHLIISTCFASRCAFLLLGLRNTEVFAALPAQTFAQVAPPHGLGALTLLGVEVLVSCRLRSSYYHTKFVPPYLLPIFKAILKPSSKQSSKPTVISNCSPRPSALPCSIVTLQG